MHENKTALIGVACTELCEQLASLSSVLNVPFVSARGCYASSSDTYRHYSMTLPVAPRDHALGKVVLKFFQKFGQVFHLKSLFFWKFRF